MRIEFTSKETKVIKAIVSVFDPSASFSSMDKSGSCRETSEGGLDIQINEAYIAGMDRFMNEIKTFLYSVKGFAETAKVLTKNLRDSKGYKEYHKELDEISGKNEKPETAGLSVGVKGIIEDAVVRYFGEHPEESMFDFVNNYLLANGYIVPDTATKNIIFNKVALIKYDEETRASKSEVIKSEKVSVKRYAEIPQQPKYDTLDDVICGSELKDHIIAIDNAKLGDRLELGSTWFELEEFSNNVYCGAAKIHVYRSLKYILVKVFTPNLKDSLLEFNLDQ